MSLAASMVREDAQAEMSLAAIAMNGEGMWTKLAGAYKASNRIRCEGGIKS